MTDVALHSQRLDILSLCTGGAGLDLGLELAIPGARSVCMVEREAFSAAQLVSAMEAGHLAPAPVWSDARTFDGRRWRGCVDGLIGGIPCQPHSMAGRKRGSHDPRDLWSTARRIVVQSRCWFVLIENVGGMLSAGDDEIAGAERVWRDLRKLGFKVEIGLFTAAEVGASHERERIFILGVADAECDGGPAGVPAPSGGFGEPAKSTVFDDDRDVLALPDSGGQSGIGIGDGGRGGDARRLRAGGDPDGCHPPVDDALGGRRTARRNDHGVDDGDQSRSAGEGPVGAAPVADTAGAGRGSERAQRGSVEGGGSGAPRGVQSGRLDGEICAGRLFPPGPGDINGWHETLDRAPELEPAFRRVADGLATRMDIARVDRLRMLGNGVVPLAAAYAFRTLATRLAGRGSAGAARLVRLMEDAS